MTARILIVEDEEELAKGLEINLRNEGHQVFVAGDGEAALDLASKENPDLIILDIMLPGISGLDVCRELRKQGNEVPVIMLTAKSEEIDRVVGLEIGADDYVTKPFSVRELLARINVRLRRSVKSLRPLDRYHLGDIEIDFERYVAKQRGKELELAPKEYEVLRFLIVHEGEVITRDQLLDEVWGYTAYPNTRTVDNHILKLRQKLEEDPGKPRYILSIYGEGYKFVS